MEFQETATAVAGLLRPYCEIEPARRGFLASVLGEKHPVLNQIRYSGPFSDFVVELLQGTLLTQNDFDGLADDLPANA